MLQLFFFQGLAKVYCTQLIVFARMLCTPNQKRQSCCLDSLHEVILIGKFRTTYSCFAVWSLDDSYILTVIAMSTDINFTRFSSEYNPQPWCYHFHCSLQRKLAQELIMSPITTSMPPAMMLSLPLQ